MELLKQPGSPLKKPLQSLLLKVPMLWTAAVMNREILWEDPFASYPALFSHLLSVGTATGTRHKPGFSVCLLTSVRQRGTFHQAVLRSHNNYGCYSNYARQMLFPAPVSEGSPLTHKTLLPPWAHCSALPCAVPLLCTAGGSLEAYLKPCHGGQMGMFFLKHTEILH